MSHRTGTRADNRPAMVAVTAIPPGMITSRTPVPSAENPRTSRRYKTM